MSLCSAPHGIRVRCDQGHHKVIGCLGAETVLLKHSIREIFQVVGDDDAGFAVNGGSKDVAIIRVWQGQTFYAVLETVIREPGACASISYRVLSSCVLFRSGRLASRFEIHSSCTSLDQRA
jgi:hypothetical protein